MERYHERADEALRSANAPRCRALEALQRRGIRVLLAGLLLLALGCGSSGGSSSDDADSGDADDVGEVDQTPFVPPGCPPLDNPLVDSCLDHALRFCRTSTDGIEGWLPDLSGQCIEDASSTLGWCPAQGEPSNATCHRLARDLAGVAGMYNPDESDPCVKMIFEFSSNTTYRLLYIYSELDAETSELVEHEIVTVRHEVPGGSSTTEVQCPDGTSFSVTDEQANAYKRCVGLSCP
ncbi:MAG: hypothetical protein KC609_03080 [Myxococcales bacterium]|nr:hypothetical protein [Myxococcales bacterium]